jgi:hypothetical protein
VYDMWDQCHTRDEYNFQWHTGNFPMKKGSYRSGESAFKKEMLYGFFKVTEEACSITYSIALS